MFAKLKKRVQEDVEGASVHGGSPASARRESRGSRRHDRGSLDSPSRLAEKECTRSSRESLNSEASGDTGSKEELMKLLLKRTEQVKKMEGRVSELSTIVKDRNREIDNLEKTLEKHQQENEMRFSTLNEQYQMNRAKMADGFTLALQKKDESKAELSNKLEKAEQMKNKMFQQEEENSEVQNFATQELFKVKHMLLLRQKELTSATDELTEKTESLNEAQKSLTSLRSEVQSLMEQITFLTQNNEKCISENRQLEEKCTNTLVERESFETYLNETKIKLTEKTASYQSLEKSYTRLQDEFRTLTRNSDLSQQKMASLLEEKDNEIDEQKEKINVLTERISVNSSTSDDDRVKGLEKERETLEKKLTEVRHQLKDVKTSWADKITHLEKQISHLNNKIAEDSDELSNFHRQHESVVSQLKLKITDLEGKVLVAESKALNNFNLVEEKESLLQKQDAHYHDELEKLKQSSSALAADFTQNIASLESKLEAATKSHLKEITAYQEKVAKLEQNEEDWLEKEIDTEHKFSNFEEQLQKYKSGMELKDKDMNVLRVELKDRQQQLENIREKSLNLEEQNKKQELEIDSFKSNIRILRSEYEGCEKEKQTLLLRNAELSQKFEAFKKEAGEGQLDMKNMVKSQQTAISGLEQSVQDMQEEIIQNEQKIKLLEKERSSGTKLCEELTLVKSKLTDTENQLQDKTKTIRMQQQRLSDLKKTLQRELKVQALPNDELEPPVRSDPVESSVSNLSPTSFPGHVEPSPPVANGNDSSTNISSKKYADKLSIPLRTNGHLTRSQSHLSLQQAEGGLTLWQDTNFEYLKHVVLKFVLSRETESLQLIRAIATLLKLSPQEQQLCQETLKWKTSWFGSRPKLGEGQKAKYIPPS